MKNSGVVIDFLNNFKGVFIMKQEQEVGFFSIDFNSCYKDGTVIYSTKSTGLLPNLSLTFLEEPLISKDLTGLVLLRVSTLFTAK